MLPGDAIWTRVRGTCACASPGPGLPQGVHTKHMRHGCQPLVTPRRRPPPLHIQESGWPKAALPSWACSHPPHAPSLLPITSPIPTTRQKGKLDNTAHHPSGGPGSPALGRACRGIHSFGTPTMPGTTQNTGAREDKAEVEHGVLGRADGTATFVPPRPGLDHRATSGMNSPEEQGRKTWKHVSGDYSQ